MCRFHLGAGLEALAATSAGIAAHSDHLDHNAWYASQLHHLRSGVDHTSHVDPGLSGSSDRSGAGARAHGAIFYRCGLTIRVPDTQRIV